MNERYGEKLKSIEASINELIEQYEKRNRFIFFFAFSRFQSLQSDSHDTRPVVKICPSSVVLEQTESDLEFLKKRISDLNWIIR